MTTAGLVGAVDVHYRGQQATAALVVCRDPAFAVTVSEHVVAVADVAEYESGALYKRELPCIRAVLEEGPQLELLVVDGFATLDPSASPGLGARAAEMFGIPVIGVAKTPFRTATHALEVLRGSASRPLFVTSAGRLDVTEAARIVSAMAGPHRLPTAVKRVDDLARGKVRPGEQAGGA